MTDLLKEAEIEAAHGNDDRAQFYLLAYCEARADGAPYSTVDEWSRVRDLIVRLLDDKAAPCPHGRDSATCTACADWSAR
jgi:hypothetical protein